MDCPNCLEKMSETNASGIQTRSCLYCSGVWVSERALAMLLKQEASTLDIRDTISRAEGELSPKRLCAFCPAKKLKVITVQGVEIDACETCGGIFFDEHEIKAILPRVHKPLGASTGQVFFATEGLSWLLLLLFSSF